MSHLQRYLGTVWDKIERNHANWHNGWLLQQVVAVSRQQKASNASKALFKIPEATIISAEPIKLAVVAQYDKINEIAPINSVNLTQDAVYAHVAEIRCYNCDKPGHIKPKCPKLRNRNARQRDFAPAPARGMGREIVLTGRFKGTITEKIKRFGEIFKKRGNGARGRGGRRDSGRREGARKKYYLAENSEGDQYEKNKEEKKEEKDPYAHYINHVDEDTGYLVRRYQPGGLA